MTRNIITDKLVVGKTGKTLEHWYGLLDRKKAGNMSHAEIFELVSSIPRLHPLGSWNQNLLSTSYEWSRGLKKRGERKDGIEISTSKTINVPVGLLYQAWVHAPSRKKWLGSEDIVIRKSTRDKSARITWSDGITSLSVDFYVKGPGKSQVVVQHQKISDRAKADAMKKFWSDRLNKLKGMLERASLKK
jgi:hypothetical protein